MSDKIMCEMIENFGVDSGPVEKKINRASLSNTTDVVEGGL